MLHCCDRHKYSLFSPLKTTYVTFSICTETRKQKVLPIKDKAYFFINCTENKQKKNPDRVPFLGIS